MKKIPLFWATKKEVHAHVLLRSMTDPHQRPVVAELTLIKDVLCTPITTTSTTISTFLFSACSELDQDVRSNHHDSVYFLLCVTSSTFPTKHPAFHIMINCCRQHSDRTAADSVTCLRLPSDAVTVTLSGSNVWRLAEPVT